MRTISETPAILPKPWVDRTHLITSQISLLAKLGQGIEKTLRLETSSVEYRLNADSASRHWRFAVNQETSVGVMLCLVETFGIDQYENGGHFDLSPIYISFFSPTTLDYITGTDLRNLPIKSICSAYSLSYWNDEYIAKRDDLLSRYEKTNDESEAIHIFIKSNYLAKLPSQYSRKPWFSVLVAYQYDAVSMKYPHENVAENMFKINHPAAKSTVQRWITNARKMNLLAPARLVK